MSMIVAAFDDVRLRMGPGVLAFFCEDWFGRRIQHFTDGPVSHVSGVMPLSFEPGRLFPINGEAIAEGCVVRPAVETVEYWLDLHRTKRKKAQVWYLPFDLSKMDSVNAYYDTMFDFAGQNDLGQKQTKYSLQHLLVYRRGERPDEDDTEKVVCSELVGLSLKASGTINCTPMLTPIEVCQLALYGRDYYWFGNHDEPWEINGYNSIDPDEVGHPDTCDYFRGFVEQR